MTNGVSSRTTQTLSHNGTSGQLFSPAPGFDTDAYISPATYGLQHQSLLRHCPFVSVPSIDKVPIPLESSAHSEGKPTKLANFPEDSEVSWSAHQFQGFLDFSDVVPIETCPATQTENGENVLPSEDNAKRSDWHWADQLMSVEDVFDPNWTELLTDVDVTEPKEKVLEVFPDAHEQQPQVHQDQIVSAPPGELSLDVNQLSAAPQSKPCMRWTPELHESFVAAVNQLGGSERATPKCLETYECERAYDLSCEKPPAGGSSEKKPSTIDEMKSIDLKTSMGITEALRLQIEVQKRLHEQLELRIEEQGRYLQMMFEKQRKLESEGSKATSSAVSDDPSPRVAAQSDLKNERTETPDQNSPKMGVEPSDTSPDGSSPSGKHKMQETRTVEEMGPSSPKRARG